MRGNHAHAFMATRYKEKFNKKEISPEGSTRPRRRLKEEVNKGLAPCPLRLVKYIIVYRLEWPNTFQLELRRRASRLHQYSINRR